MRTVYTVLKTSTHHLMTIGMLNSCLNAYGCVCDTKWMCVCVCVNCGSVFVYVYAVFHFIPHFLAESVFSILIFVSTNPDARSLFHNRLCTIRPQLCFALHSRVWHVPENIHIQVRLRPISIILFSCWYFCCC